MKKFNTAKVDILEISHRVYPWWIFKWAFLFFLLGFFFSNSVSADQTLSIKQQILMPGKLIEGHAKYESQCETCHISFSKKDMTKLCLDCHEDIAKDRIDKSGFHGQGKLASTNDCETCHKDHKGRDADIVGALPDSFDHTNTRFPLLIAHQSVQCNACHKTDEPFRGTDSTCISCHKKNDVHKGAVGDQCESCHQATQWKTLQTFDHSKTDFELKGAHLKTTCNSCHISQQFKFNDTSCISCHKASDVHAGANGNQCASCHSENKWSQVNFDHNKTEFPLKESHSEIPCRACHTNDRDRKEMPMTCNGCHASNDIHLGRNGTKCGSCHDTRKWTQVTFSHDRDTDFQLTGKHQKVECSQCHAGALDDPIPRDCASCHRVDDPHKNENMKVCGLCHSSQGWKVTSEFDHDFTSFPLLGMHQIVACESCHISNQFSTIDQSCKSCHKNDVHEGALGRNCDQCHNPNAWNIWQFNHTKETGFALDGKHENIACASCHLPGTKPEDTPTSCGNCHHSQDIHNGEFGLQCGQCHNTSNFFELFMN